MKDSIAGRYRKTDFEDGSLSVLDSGGEAGRLQVSIAAPVVCLLAVLLIVRQFSAPARIVNISECKSSFGHEN